MISAPVGNLHKNWKAKMYTVRQALTKSTFVFLALGFNPLFLSMANADHLSNAQCYNYFNCVLGQESALNQCYDNNFLKEISITRTTCMRMAQHQCKVVTGIQETGRKMTLSRPLRWYARPSLLDQEEGIVALVPEDIRIYNYGGWNHCPIQYQGLEDFWCDPEQLRYPPEPWCDVLPKYNLGIEIPPHANQGLNPLRLELLKKLEGSNNNLSNDK